jgi:hypothetical protein
MARGQEEIAYKRRYAAFPCLIEPIAGNDFRARIGEPLALTAEGATRKDVVKKLRELIADRLTRGQS